jgi:hypothetical protein
MQDCDAKALVYDYFSDLCHRGRPLVSRSDGIDPN